jgi:hypothetical protein
MVLFLLESSRTIDASLSPGLGAGLASALTQSSILALVLVRVFFDTVTYCHMGGYHQNHMNHFSIGITMAPTAAMHHPIC